MQVAVVGTRIAGLTCAHVLSPHHDVTVFEAEDRPGGHTHTVEVTVTGAAGAAEVTGAGSRTLAVDTGFLVYNERTYPGLVRLFAELGIATEPSDMSFSVADEVTGIEYRGTSVGSVFAQRRNLLRPAFLRMLADVVRFNRAGQRVLARRTSTGTADLGYTLADLLAEGRWSEGFADWYLVPLGSSIWSADPTTFTQMPAATLFRFFDRHGMLSLGDKPAWRTVTGGARHYVDAVLAPLRDRGRLRLSSPVLRLLRSDDGVEVTSGNADTGTSTEWFDHVIVATHSDQALSMLADATPAEKEILGSIRYQPNHVTLHTDGRLMPENRRAWAAWNYHRPAAHLDRVTMTYYLNQLQGIESPIPFLVTLNRAPEIDPAAVLRTFEYSHPVIDAAAVAAQSRHREISGHHGVSFCGAYWASGFHEDGLQSALRVCRELGVDW